MDDIDPSNDETVIVKDPADVEGIILDGIRSIRKSFVRPAYSTLLEHVNNSGEFNLNMESFKRIMKDMEDNSLIYMKRKRGAESFYISGDKQEKVNAEKSSTLDGPFSTENNDIITDKIFNDIVNKVKSDVLLHITEHNLLSAKAETVNKPNPTNEINRDDDFSERKRNDNDLINDHEIRDVGKAASTSKNEYVTNANDDSLIHNYNEKNEQLLTAYREEIKFLRNELLSKNKIIELILAQSSNTNSVNV